MAKLIVIAIDGGNTDFAGKEAAEVNVLKSLTQTRPPRFARMAGVGRQGAKIKKKNANHKDTMNLHFHK